MTLAPKSDRSAAALPTPAHWEDRSTNRVVEADRDETLERRRRFVEAAYDLLEEEGLEGLTIRAVLRKTGLARRAFYERFEGKDDLMLAVFEETIRSATVLFNEQFEALSDPLERLKLVVTSIGLGQSPSDPQSERRSRRGAAMSREHLRLAESRPDDLQAALSLLISLIAEQLSEGMELGLVRSDNPQHMAVLVYNLVSTTAHTEFLAQESARPDPQRRSRLAADIWEFCRRAIAA